MRSRYEWHTILYHVGGTSIILSRVQLYHVGGTSIIDGERIYYHQVGTALPSGGGADLRGLNIINKLVQHFFVPGTL